MAQAKRNGRRQARLQRGLLERGAKGQSLDSLLKHGQGIAASVEQIGARKQAAVVLFCSRSHGQPAIYGLLTHGQRGIEIDLDIEGFGQNARQSQNLTLAVLSYMLHLPFSPCSPVRLPSVLATGLQETCSRCRFKRNRVAMVRRGHEAAPEVGTPSRHLGATLWKHRSAPARASEQGSGSPRHFA